MRHLLPLIVLLLLVSNFGITFAQDGPPVERIGVDFGVVGGYRYMRVIGSNVPVLSAPEDGRVLYRFEGGYDFVTPRNEEGEWVEINPGEWVHEDNLFEVYASQFNGVRILGASSAPWGWILVNHHASDAPGGAEVVDESHYIQKYQLATFYNAAPDSEGWIWYDIGGGRWVKQTLVSKVNIAGNPGISGRWVAVDLYEQNLVAYEGNTPVFATLVASGLPGNDTNPGVFEIWGANRNRAMDGTSGGYGDYRLENVPYAMYFDGDISLHGTYWHNGFGYRQSRGCVNLTISDARWLYDWMGADGSVYVYYSQPY
jgi:lipoprotein-anchoring transpeptidase ErfK/SrfK